jgi:hypothetical protein
VVHRNAPADLWTRQTIDLRAAYAAAGWPLPALRRVSYRGLDLDLPIVTLQLFVRADNELGQVRAYFGPLEQDLEVLPARLMGETLDDPTQYYVRLAGEYVRERNYTYALEAYRQALTYSRDDPQMLEWLSFELQRLSIESPR